MDIAKCSYNLSLFFPLVVEKKAWIEWDGGKDSGTNPDWLVK